jgi:alpha-L-fucosidase
VLCFVAVVMMIGPTVMAQNPTLPELQQQYVNRKLGMFLHFNMGTFTGEEWASPNRPLATFNPTALNTDQWADAAVAAGMKYGVLTAKHHDGFALWDSSRSTYDVFSTPWAAGQAAAQRDIVQRYVNSFRSRGLAVGIY